MIGSNSASPNYEENTMNRKSFVVGSAALMVAGCASSTTPTFRRDPKPAVITIKRQGALTLVTFMQSFPEREVTVAVKNSDIAKAMQGKLINAPFVFKNKYSYQQCFAAIATYDNQVAATATATVALAAASGLLPGQIVTGMMGFFTGLGLGGAYGGLMLMWGSEATDENTMNVECST
jgi:hypothetical protein